VGDVMAELITTGSSSTPIEPFHIARFAGREIVSCMAPRPF
jgi:sarcosine oxidase subunit beta